MISSSLMWQAQHLLHGKNSNALPALLLAVAGILVMYRHMTEEVWEGNQLKTFLALIMIQMLPLVLIEIKISSCPDPMSLLSRFGPKVLLMHACFLGPRCIYNGIMFNSFTDILGLIGSCAALHVAFGFRMTLRTMYEHRDVFGLLFLAFLTAVVEESLFIWNQSGFSWDLALIIAACNYAEILAFMPAVWMVFRGAGELSPCPTAGDADIRRKATYFFGFMVAFYVCEDICQIPSVWEDYKLAALAHIAHFLLVLDFAGFMLAHIYSPEKIKDGLMLLKASFGAGTLV